MGAAKAISKARTGPLLSLVSTGATVVMLTGLCAGAVLGMPALQKKVGSRLDDRPPEIHFDWPVALGSRGSGGEPGATWLDERFQAALVRVASDAARGSPDALGDDQLRAVSDAAMRTGWFVRPPLVRREGVGLRISGVWHVQAAVVRQGQTDRMIGWGAELLPLECPAGESGLPVITGAATSPPTDGRGRVRLGSPWPGEDVRAALDLLALMQKQEFRTQVAGVDVSGYRKHGKGGWLVLLTDCGRVVWGARPGASAIEHGEVSTDRKLLNMAQLFAQTGRLDGGRREVEVRSEVVVVNESAGASGP